MRKLPAVALIFAAAAGAHARPFTVQERTAIAQAMAELRPHLQALEAQLAGDSAFAGISLDGGAAPTANIYLKGDARARLARYTRDPRFIPVSVERSAAELERIHDRVYARLRALGIEWSTIGVHAPSNKVCIGSPDPERLHAAGRAGLIDLRGVEVIFRGRTELRGAARPLR